MATTNFDNKESFKTENVHHQQIIIENPMENHIHLSYCEMQQKNKPQSNSIIGGNFLLTVSGLHIGWGIWRFAFNLPWFFTITTQGMFIFLLMSWYVFAIIGSIVGARLVTNMKKKFIYYIGGALLVISSIMFIAVYKNHVGIIVGRCLAGFAHGIIYNATITHAAENVVKEIRGMLLSSVNLMMFCGVFVSTILTVSVTYTYYNNSSLTSDVVIGIFGLVLSVAGIICTTFLTYESVPYLLRRDDEQEAIVNLLKLRNESVMTTKLTNDLEEMKLMVGQDRRDDQNILSNGNGSATGKMIILRILSTLTNNFLINIVLINFTLLLVPSNYELAPVILSGTRFAAATIPLFSTDFIKRKIHLAVSGFTSGLLILILAIIVAAVSFTTSATWVLGTLSILFQIFVSLGIDPMQHLLLSEAFSTSKKAWSIALVTSVEYLLQILFIGVYFANPLDRVRILVILFITSGVMLALSLLLQLAIPETFKKTIKETRDLFCN